jgi:hypothetical protein
LSDIQNRDQQTYRLDGKIAGGGMTESPIAISSTKSLEHR